MCPIQSSMSTGWRWYGMGARYSISWRAISVIVVAPGVASSTAVEAPTACSDVSSLTQNAWMRASSRRLSMRGVVHVPVGVEVAPAQRGGHVESHRQSLVSLRYAERCGFAASGPRRSILFAS